MDKQEMYIPSSVNGKRLHVVIWRPEGEPLAVLQLTHGMCEYIDRYDDFARHLNGLGIAVIGHDHLGHGGSVSTAADLGYFADKPAAENLIDDIHAVTLLARQEFPNALNFLLGHSMGSFFARRYLALYGADISGAVVMGTGWVPSPVPQLGRVVATLISLVRGRRCRSKLLGGMVLGASEKAFASEGRLAWLSVNKANVRRYEADPLCGFAFTAGAYRDFFDIMAALAAQRGFDGIPRDLPVLVISGEKDPVGGAPAVRQVAAQLRALGLKDVTEKTFPGDRHEILNESDREAVYAFIDRWIMERC